MKNQYPLISKYVVCATGKTCDKKWRRIVINGIVTDYEMNENAVLRHVKTKRIHDGHITQAGYYTYLLTLHDKDTEKTNKITLFKHRLVCCLFMPIPRKYLDMGYQQEYLEVNHKDGNKLNCDLSNLEWCTPTENQIHALDNNLKFSRGEDCPMNKYNEESIIQICELLQQGIHPKEITTITDIPIGSIWSIAYGRTWNSISKNYTFPNFQEKSHDFTVCEDELIHKICRMLVETNLSLNQIAKECGVTKSTVNNINKGRRHQEIVAQYNLPR